MAARRLLIVMLVLLGMSTLAAALAPPPTSRDTSTTSSSTAAERASGKSGGGKLVEATIMAQARDPKVLRIRRGDQLALTVKSKRAGQVHIRGLGLIEDVAPLSPARFDVLADDRGGYQVRLLDPERKLGVIRLGGR